MTGRGSLILYGAPGPLPPEAPPPRQPDPLTLVLALWRAWRAWRQRPVVALARVRAGRWARLRAWWRTRARDLEMRFVCRDGHTIPEPFAAYCPICERIPPVPIREHCDIPACLRSAEVLVRLRRRGAATFMCGRCYADAFEFVHMCEVQWLPHALPPPTSIPGPGVPMKR